MTNRLFIKAQVETADLVQRRLSSHGIQSKRLNPDQALRFGITISTGKVTIEVSSEEINELARTASEMVEAFFDTLDRFRERIVLPMEVPKRRLGSGVRPLTIEEFMRGESGFQR